MGYVQIEHQYRRLYFPVIKVISFQGNKWINHHLLIKALRPLNSTLVKKYYTLHMFKKHFPKFGQSSRHREGLENYLKSIVVNGSILDIGGGQKPIINRLSTKCNIEKYQIMDLPIPHSHNSTNVTYEVDIQSPILNHRLISTHFDAIFCLEVSLYWHDPMQALRNIVDLMSPGTKLYINFHQFYANQKPISADMLRYNINWIEKISKILNLKIIDIHLSSITKLSYFALIFSYKSERMRTNMDYKYLDVSSFLVILEINND